MQNDIFTPLGGLPRGMFFKAFHRSLNPLTPQSGRASADLLTIRLPKRRKIFSGPATVTRVRCPLNPCQARESVAGCADSTPDKQARARARAHGVVDDDADDDDQDDDAYDADAAHNDEADADNDDHDNNNRNGDGGQGPGVGGSGGSQ